MCHHWQLEEVYFFTMIYTRYKLNWDPNKTFMMKPFSENSLWLGLVRLFLTILPLTLKCQKSCAGFDLTTCNSYFTILVEVFTNHISDKNTYFINHIKWPEHKVPVLKPANKYQVIWQCHSFKSILLTITSIIHFFYWVKDLEASLFTKLKMTNY